MQKQCPQLRRSSSSPPAGGAHSLAAGDVAPSAVQPLLSGGNPDPTICRVGDDYYIATSSFSLSPGLPVYRSKDMVNWEVISHAWREPWQYGYNIEFGDKWNGHEKPADEHGLYFRKFTVQSEWRGKCVKLCFEGVMTEANVKVNGKVFPPHHSAWFPFEFDISDLVNYAGENTLEIRLDSFMHERG